MLVEVKDKWKNLYSIVKKEFVIFRREIKKIGGGLVLKFLSVFSEKIIEVFEDIFVFSGLNGFEVGM